MLPAARVHRLRRDAVHGHHPVAGDALLFVQEKAAKHSFLQPANGQKMNTRNNFAEL